MASPVTIAGCMALVAWTRWLLFPDWSAQVDTKPPGAVTPASALTHSFRPAARSGAGVVASRNFAVATALGLKPVRNARALTVVAVVKTKGSV